MTSRDAERAVPGQLTVRVLGPFEVDVGGRRVELTAGRLRALLATLAMSAGRVVPVEQVATALWHTELPEDERRSLRTYVTRLRAAVGVDAIGTGPQGYLLRAEPDQVDALRFLRLVEAARGGTDRDRQDALLREALGLWRGSPFEGVPSHWFAEAHSPRLVEAYLAATERRIDFDIEAQQYAGLVAELTDLTARFPLRESLWLRLLVVLDRTGLPAEALARYEQMRRYLAEELGVDPGPDLRRIHADLLAGRPARPGGDVGSVPRVVPGQLPADLESFTGRARHLADLDALLPDGRGGPPIVIVHGPAGVGKTALAVHWAHRVKGCFPDGQVYVNLRGYDPSRSAVPAAEAVRCVLESVSAQPAQVPPDLPAQVAMYRSLLAGKRMLLVLDNAHDADQVRPLLPGAAGCLVLVTSRHQLSGLAAAEGAHPVRLDLLTAAEARRLLVHRLGEARVTSAPEAVDEIIDRCARLPLALAIVAARAATNPTFALSALAAELRATHGRLDAFAAGDAATDLRTVFSWSYRTLGPAAARLFRRLGLPTGPDITADAAAALAGTAPREAGQLLGELARANLVHEHKPGRYTMHDLLRAFAAELAAEHDDPRERAASTSWMLGFYLATARRAVLLLAPGDNRRIARGAEGRRGGLELADEQAALVWLDAERPNLMAAVSQAASTPGAPERMAPQLAHALFAYFSVRPHWDDWARVNHLALDAARRLGDRGAVAQIAYDLGFVAWLRARFDEARSRFEECLTIWRELGDEGGEAAGLAGLGDVHRVLGNAGPAIARYEESLAICRRIGDLRGQTLSLGSLGLLYQGEGRPDEAMDCLRESLAIREKLGDRRGQATSLSNLGGFHRHEGRYDEALRYYERSLQMRREQGDRHGEGTSLAGLGAVCRESGRPGRSLGYLRDSVTIFRELADDQCLVGTLRALAAALDEVGRGKEAAELRREAADVSARLGTPDTDPAAPAAGAPSR